MGIDNGSLLISNIQGLYKNNPNRYSIYVDGELMRYKGICNNNSVNNPELSIAQISIIALKKVISDVELHLRKQATSVYIHMDGLRVSNKQTRNSVLCSKGVVLNNSLIRKYFSTICIENNYTVVENGEAELQMYLNRDKTNDLNVFITADSDLIAICYDHIPKINLEKQKFDFKIINTIQDSIFYSTTGGRNIQDINYTYKNDLNITDSAVWVNISNLKSLKFIGLDYLNGLVYTLEPDIFRTFVALCGTDFTKSESSCVLTKSMMSSIIDSIKTNSHDVSLLNELRHTNEIVLGLLWLCFRSNRSVRLGVLTCLEKPNMDDFIISIVTYITYITTGQMPTVNYSKPNNKAVLRHYLTKMIGSSDLKILNLVNFCKQNDLSYILSNCVN